MSYKILLRRHPFIQTSYEVIEKTNSKSIEKLLKELDINHRYVFAINGVISDDLKYKPKDGDLITIKVLPEGGPDEARSAGSKTAGWGSFLVVVGFITSFFFAPVGLAIMGAGLTVGFVGAGIMGIADMWDKLSKSANVTMTKNLPQIAGSRNSINPWGKIPVVLGTHKISPYYASKPYTTISGTDGDTQYLYELFAIGYKTLSISDIKIGETLLASNSADVRNGTITINGNYSDVTLEIRQDGTLPANWSNTILEDSISVQAKYGKETWRTTPDKTTKAVVEIYLPRGLFKYKDDGGIDNHSVTVEVKYRTAGSTTPWASCSSIGTLNITRNTTTAMRFRFEKTLTAGKYEIGVKRISNDDTTDSKKMSDTYWSIMQSWTASAPVSTSMLGKVCLLAVKIKATDQLNGVIDNLNLIAKSVVRVGPNWNTSTISNNPADLFVHVATQAANARAIPDNKIDWSIINAWRTTCANKGWTCNAVITSGEKLKSILNRIAQTGRASLNLRDGLYSVVVDEPKATIVQHFTNKNVKNFAWTKSFAKTPHGLRVNFLSAIDGYASSERKVFDDGYTEANATEYMQLDMWGITDPSLAWKHGRYRIACMKLRPEIYTFETDPEGIICEPGDLVLVSHDAISVGQKSGRIKNLIISGSTITGFELDEIVTMETGKNYGVKIRKNDGTFVSYQITTSAGDKTTVSLTSAIPVSGGPQVDDLYTFGEYGTETLRCIVIGYEPTSDYGIKLYLTDEAPGVHTADSGTIPDYKHLITRQAEEVTLDKISGEIARIDNDLSGLSGTLNGTPSKRINVNLYQVLTTTPELPSADVTVDLLNNTYTNLTNNWSPTQPQAVREPVWMINYSTIIPVTQNEITITAASWHQPIKIYIGTPIYLGMTASVPNENSFPDKIEGDWCLCTTNGKFYKWTGSAWTDTGITTANKMAALQDLLTIAGASDATAFCQTLVSVDAFIQELFSKYIQVGGSIRGGGRYDQNGNIINSNAAGFYFDSAGSFKLKGGTIDDGIVYEFRYQRSATQPTTPTGDNPSGWYTDPSQATGTNPLWMTRGLKNSSGVLQGTWSTPVKATGETGQYTDYRYAKNTSQDTAPSYTANADNPGSNWYDAPPSLGAGEYLWMISADWRGTTRLTNWTAPVRISGPQGATGPQGPQGVTGNYYELRYQRSATQPATPTGDNPTGWYTDPSQATGTNPLWMTRGLKNSSGVLQGPWSTPIKITQEGTRWPPDANLVAYYSCDNVIDKEVQDSSANKLHGTVVGTVTTSQDSVVGKALSFNGSSCVQLANDDRLKPANEITVSAWFNIAAAPSIYGYIILVGRDISSGYCLYINNQLQLMARYQNTSNRIIYYSPSLSLNTWHHAVLVYNSSSGCSLYVNGNLVATSSSTGQLVYPGMFTGAPSIGSHGTLYYFNGLIDEVRIYNKALSHDEIVSLYNLKATTVITQRTPKYLGTTADNPPTASTFSSDRVSGDWCLSTTAKQFYRWDGTAWVTTGITQGMKSEGFLDLISLADASDTQLFAQQLVAVDAFIQNLMSKYLKITGSLRTGNRYDANGNVVDNNASGSYLGADGTLKARSVNIELVNIFRLKVTGRHIRELSFWCEATGNGYVQVYTDLYGPDNPTVTYNGSGAWFNGLNYIKNILGLSIGVKYVITGGIQSLDPVAYIIYYAQEVSIYGKDSDSNTTNIVINNSNYDGNSRGVIVF